MCQFATEFIEESAPRRLLTDVNVVSGDCVFDQEMVIEIGFVNAKFITEM